jgi:hypothetical protein
LNPRFHSKRGRQLALPGFQPRSEHGGGKRKGQRKLMRPIDPKRPLHVTMRSTRAKGSLSMLSGRNAKTIARLQERLARRFHIRVLRSANVGNHLHLLIRGRTRVEIQRFFRAFAGSVAREITGARKGRAFGKFWDELLYSKVVEWGRQLSRTLDYVFMNELEAAGVWHRARGIPWRARGSGTIAGTGSASSQR